MVLVSGGNDVSAWTVLVTRDADEYTPSYEDKLVVPGEETKSAPTFTKVDEDGNETEEKVDAPEGSKFAIPEDFKAPEGYVVTIDENTGEITVTFPDKSKLNKDTVEEFDVPVVVTYPDGSKDNVDVTVIVEEPNAPEQPDVKDNEKYDPEYKGGSGKPGTDVKVEKPEFKDKDGNPTEAPDAKFTPGENVPDGVTVDEKTGESQIEGKYSDGGEDSKVSSREVSKYLRPYQIRTKYDLYGGYTFYEGHYLSPFSIAEMQLCSPDNKAENSYLYQNIYWPTGTGHVTK